MPKVNLVIEQLAFLNLFYVTRCFLKIKYTWIEICYSSAEKRSIIIYSAIVHKKPSHS